MDVPIGPQIISAWTLGLGAPRLQMIARAAQKQRPGTLARSRAAGRGSTYLVNPQKTSRIMPRSFNVRVSPTR